jgi:hypothetical protein
MKKVVFMMVLAAAVAGGAWGQSEPKNWISGEASLLGAGVSYERMLTPNFSVGGTMFYHTFFFFFTSLGVNVTGSFYPWAGMFYTEIGLGFGSNFTLNGAMITPAVGWKIDVGKTGGFFLNPELSVPLVLGVEEDWRGEKEFGILAIPRVSFGMGYAF